MRKEEEADDMADSEDRGREARQRRNRGRQSVIRCGRREGRLVDSGTIVGANQGGSDMGEANRPKMGGDISGCRGGGQWRLGGMIGRGALATRHADTPGGVLKVPAFQGSVQCYGPLWNPRNSLWNLPIGGLAHEVEASASLHHASAGGSVGWLDLRRLQKQTLTRLESLVHVALFLASLVLILNLASAVYTRVSCPE